MKAKKRKILWLDVWNIEEQEAWFSDMSVKGWKLTRINQLFATFEKSEPVKVNYRCEIFKLNSKEEHERIEFYKQHGWEYIASRLDVHVFREIVGEDVEEIHTDPIEQAETVKILKQNINKRGILTLVLLIITVVIMVAMLRIDPVGNYLNDGFIQIAFYAVLYIYISYTMVSGMFHMSKLVNKLHSGKLLNHNINYKHKLKRKRFIGISMVLITFSWVIAVYVNLLTDTADRYPPIPDKELPVVQFTDFIDGSVYTKVTDIGDEGDRSNFYNINSSFLVPKQYELRQNVELPGVSWEDGSGTYSPTLWSYGYELRGTWLTHRFVKAFINDQDPYEVYNRVFDTSFDELWVSEEAYKSAFIARIDSNVYRVVYFGMEPIEAIIEQAEIKFVD